MKKFLSLLLMLALIISLTACTKSNDESKISVISPYVSDSTVSSNGAVDDNSANSDDNSSPSSSTDIGSTDTNTDVVYFESSISKYASIEFKDEKGNVFQLLAPGTIPALVNPMPFVYDNTLGLIGGEERGEISSKCYVSYNSGKSWELDTHKDLAEIGNGISQAGLLVTSRNGELMLIGGKSAKGYQTTVWKGVLNKLNEDELIYGK